MSANYEVVKGAILRTYKLVPEAYRQLLRSNRRTYRQTYVEFAKEKNNLMDRWCMSQKVESREQLRQLSLLEEFKNCVPKGVATYVKEQKVTRLDEAAVLSDEFVLTHKLDFRDNQGESKGNVYVDFAHQ